MADESGDRGRGDESPEARKPPAAPPRPKPLPLAVPRPAARPEPAKPAPKPATPAMADAPTEATASTPGAEPRAETDVASGAKASEGEGAAPVDDTKVEARARVATPPPAPAATTAPAEPEPAARPRLDTLPTVDDAGWDEADASAWEGDATVLDRKPPEVRALLEAHAGPESPRRVPAPDLDTAVEGRRSKRREPPARPTPPPPPEPDEITNARPGKTTALLPPRPAPEGAAAHARDPALPETVPPPPPARGEVTEVLPDALASVPPSRPPAPPPLSAVTATTTVRRPPPTDPSVLEDLAERARRLSDPDPIGAARARLELGLWTERVTRDLAAARRHYDAARSLAPRLAPALSRLRRVHEARADLASALRVIGDEIALAVDDGERADLLAERARMAAELGDHEEARAAYDEALAIAPRHAASLAGLEAVLRRALAERPDARLAAELDAHLERLAGAVAPRVSRAEGAARDDGDARLAAWVEVERAEVVEELAGDAARALPILERAVALDPEPGPARDALRRHLVRHGETARLCVALAEEAAVEPDAARASRLEYAAARLAADVLRAPRDAVVLLERAIAHAPEASPTFRRALSELVERLEATGELERAATLRKRRLALLATPEARAHEHVRISAAYDALGRASDSATHAAEALALGPDDVSTRERLDRALSRLGRHEERLKVWQAAGARATRPSPERARALVRAADIADRQLGRADEAIASLRAAWVLDPGNPDVFDALSAKLVPPPAPAAGDPRGVRARIDLYTQGAEAARDPARAVALQEKLAALWEDEMGDPPRAIEVLERVLAVEPKRRTALVAMQRLAERAGDHERLVRALVAEAELTASAEQRRRLLVRAADVTAERLGDRERAAELGERALAAQPGHPEALRALFRLHDRADRKHEALAALRALVATDPDDAFEIWLEIARLEEQRKKGKAAVEAYEEAARRRPGHPLPKAEIARILRQTADLERLAASLGGLAAETKDRAARAALRFEAAEVAEVAGNRTAALAHLACADEDAPGDPAVAEARERIHLAHGDGPELAALYNAWLEQKPSAVVDHGLRIALGRALTASGDTRGAAELLEELIAVVPDHVPALRLLANLYRASGAHRELAGTLRRQADVFVARVARAGALWEMVALEGELGQAIVLEALARLAIEAPGDTGVLDTTLRVATERATQRGVSPGAPEALLEAIVKRRAATRDPLSRATFQLEEALLFDTEAEVDPTKSLAALEAYRAALGSWPESVLAAHGLARLARKLGDATGTVAAELALARLSTDARMRARHLVAAAELVVHEGPGPGSQTTLFEEALAADPENVVAATALARLLAKSPGRLADVLGAALARTSSPEVVAIAGRAVGEAALRHDGSVDAPDATVGIAALRRAIAVRGDDPAMHLVLGRLLAAARLPVEAEHALVRAASTMVEAEPRVVAQLELARLYEGPLADPIRAQAALEAALAIDPHRRAPLERLHAIATARGDRALAVHTLARLVDGETEPGLRLDRALRLSELGGELGDTGVVVRALADAIVTAPGDARPWASLARLFRVDARDGAASYAAALEAVLGVAAARRAPIDPRWLGTLGMLEIRALGRPREGLARLAQATALPGATPEARALLGRGLEAAGHTTDAVRVLRDVLHAPDALATLPERGAALASLEAALAREGRADERIAVDEVRAVLGDLPPDRVPRLRATRPAYDGPLPGSLAGADLVRLLHAEAKTHLVDVAVALAPIAARVLRLDPAALGVSTRDRLGAREGGATRFTLDRMVRGFGLEGLDLLVPPGFPGAPRLFPGETPMLLAPASLADLGESERAFALARLSARAALGLTWLDEVPFEVGDALLLAGVRTVDPSYGLGELDPTRESAVQSLLPHVQRAIGRKAKKLVEDVAPHLGPPPDPRAFALAVRRSELRLAYLACGDLLASIDHIRRVDRDLARADADGRILLAHPLAGELARYALSAEAAAERRRVGTARTG